MSNNNLSGEKTLLEKVKEARKRNSKKVVVRWDKRKGTITFPSGRVIKQGTPEWDEWHARVDDAFESQVAYNKSHPFGLNREP